MKNTIKILALSTALTLGACAHPGQNNYGEFDVGQNIQTEFGTIVHMRKVDITGKNSGTGGAVGVGAGIAAGSAVGGDAKAQLAAMIIGAIVGGVAGNVAEQEMQNHQGIEYVIVLHNKKTVTIVQNINKDDEPLHRGQRVIVQTSGSYNRVLPADDLPTKIKKPQQIETN